MDPEPEVILNGMRTCLAEVSTTRGDDRKESCIVRLSRA